MEIDDYDDISHVRFKEPTTTDKNLQDANDRLIMKYFGSKLKHHHKKNNHHQPEEKEPYVAIPKSRKWAILKPVMLSAVIVILLLISRWQSVVNFLSFTSKDTINKIIFYGLFFIIILILISAVYMPF